MVSLPDGKDALLAPVVNGMIPYTALTDGSIDICDLYDMIEALTIKAENENRVHLAALASKDK